MTNIIIFGETMLELSKKDEHSYKKSYAGDVHSVALYLKRAVSEPNTDCYLLSGLGNDTLSEELLTVLKSQKISTDLMLRHPSRTLGLYMVNTDENGERSFDYWRSESAAKETLTLLSEQGENTLFELNPDVFFFSGITLAILSQSARTSLWSLLEKLRKQGCHIMFDPNYRPRLWKSADEAKESFQTAFTLSDTILPSLEDIEQLYSAESFEHAAEILRTYADSATLVIKDGPNGIYYADDNDTFLQQVDAVSHVVDTTAAGDSFNGSFLAAKIEKKSSREALQFAARVAAEVIQHRGAVISQEAYDKIEQL